MRELPDLAHRDHLLQTRGGGGEVVEDPAAARAARPSPGPAAASRGTRGSSARGRSRSTRGAWPVASPRTPTGPRPKIAEPRSCAAISQTITRFPRAAAAPPERVGDGRLADPSLARDEGQPLVEEVGDRAFSQAIRRPLPAGRRVQAEIDLAVPEGNVLDQTNNAVEMGLFNRKHQDGRTDWDIRSRCAEPRLVRGVRERLRGRRAGTVRATRLAGLRSRRSTRFGSGSGPRSRGAPDRRGAGAARERGRRPSRLRSVPEPAPASDSSGTLHKEELRRAVAGDGEPTTTRTPLRRRRDRPVDEASASVRARVDRAGLGAER